MKGPSTSHVLAGFALLISCTSDPAAMPSREHGSMGTDAGIFGAGTDADLLGAIGEPAHRDPAIGDAARRGDEAAVLGPPLADAGIVDATADATVDAGDPPDVPDAEPADTGLDGQGSLDAGTGPVAIAAYLDDKPSAYSLTFDDNFRSQHEVVAPLLEAHGFRATFFLVVNRICEGDDPYCYGLTWSDWQDVHGAGHEIGNHSLTHWFDDPNTTLEDNIVGAADILAARLAPPLTFAYPGSAREGTAQEIAYMDSLVLSRHIAWRQGNDENAAIVNRNYVNFGAGCETDMNGVFDDLLAHAPSNKPPHAPMTWLIGLWHGVNEGYCPVTEAALSQHVEYVAAHENAVWVAPFGDVVRYEMERKATAITVEQSSSSSVVFRASHGLDSRFDVPLTFLVDTMGQAASSASAVWDDTGQSVPATVKGNQILVTAQATGESLRV
ncbi:MAG: polysaccharide deacetylase family protein, partial [Myxococcota bacterium]